MLLRLSSILLLVILLGCQNDSKDISTAIAKKGSVIKHATHLQIFEEDSIIRIHIVRSDKKGSLFKLILSNKKPSSIPEGYSFIQTPITDIAALSSTQIGMLSKLDAISSIRAVSNEKYVYNPDLLKRIQKGQAYSLGDEGTIPMESIIQSGAKHVFFSDFGNDFPHSEQLRSLGILCIPNSDWQETHPLGKAEWIKLFGYLTGKNDLANRVFSEIEDAYTRLSELTTNLKQKPKVTSGNMIGDIWYAPAGESYNSKLLANAGADYVYKKTKGSGSTERSLEQVITENSQTEFWINPGFTKKSEILTNSPKLKHLKLIDGKNIYCYSSFMNKFWEESASAPHLVLEDLIRIFHPDLLPEGKMYFYREVE